MKKKPNKITEESIILFKKYLKEGYTQYKSAIMAEINPKSTHHLVKRYKIDVPKKFGLYRINDDYFDNIDTEEKAYIL